MFDLDDTRSNLPDHRSLAEQIGEGVLSLLYLGSIIGVAAVVLFLLGWRVD